MNSLLQKGKLSSRSNMTFPRSRQHTRDRIRIGSQPSHSPFDPFPPRKLKIKDLGKYTKNKGRFSLPKYAVLVHTHSACSPSAQKPGRKGAIQGSQGGRRWAGIPACLKTTEHQPDTLLAPSASTLNNYQLPESFTHAKWTFLKISLCDCNHLWSRTNLEFLLPFFPFFWFNFQSLVYEVWGL